MRAAAWPAAVICLALLAACGSREKEEVVEVPRAAGAAAADTATAPAPAPDKPEFKKEGYQRAFAEAGFRVYWPSGCARLSEQISSGPTGRAEREFIYNCDRDGAKGRGVGIRVFQQAHDADGAPPHPPMVTELVERQLRKSGARIVRQRPLEADGIQGVEVHAAEQGGAGEIWLRGLIAGTDVFMLMAWDQGGGLFEDPEVVDFFASFRVGSE